VADAVEALWQDMEQEAADELVRRERHDALPLGTIAAIVLVAEGDAGLVEGEQPPTSDLTELDDWGIKPMRPRGIARPCVPARAPLRLSDWRRSEVTVLG
jgi:hypothetical protein